MDGPRAYGAIFGVGVLAGVIIVAAAITKLEIRPANGNEAPMSYADLAAIMLSAVSVIVTVLGVVVAILALWGFRHFKDTAQKAAGARVDEATPEITRTVEAAVLVHIEQAMENGKIRKLMEERVDYLLKYGAELRAKDEWEGNEESETGD